MKATDKNTRIAGRAGRLYSLVEAIEITTAAVVPEDFRVYADKSRDGTPIPKYTARDITRETHAVTLMGLVNEGRITVRGSATRAPVKAADIPVGMWSVFMATTAVVRRENRAPDRGLHREFAIDEDGLRAFAQALSIDLDVAEDEADDTDAGAPEQSPAGGTPVKWTKERVTEAWEMKQRLKYEECRRNFWPEIVKKYGVRRQRLEALFAKYGLE